MNVREFALLVKTEYKNSDGARFFNERALLSALLEKNGLERNAPLMTPDLQLDEREEKLRSDLEKLLAGYPLQYYLGTEWFCGYEFYTALGVLIPRPETEALVEKAVQVAKEGSVVFDFCCGSGCIGLSLAMKREDLTCRLYDHSDAALALSEKNRAHFALSERCAIEKMDVLSRRAEEAVLRYQPSLILSNPPYLTREEMDEIDENVKNEPGMALYGGDDGLLFYRALILLCAKTGVPLICEIGCKQKEGVEKLLKERNLEYEFYQDAAGLDRVFYACKIK